MTKYANVSSLKAVSMLMALGLVTACASNQPEPDSLLAETEARIESAEESQAGNEAPVALRSARDFLTQARRSMRDEEYVEAGRNLEKALADADYAIIKSRSERMQEAAEAVRRTLETLRSELQAAQAS